MEISLIFLLRVFQPTLQSKRNEQFYFNSIEILSFFLFDCKTGTINSSLFPSIDIYYPEYIKYCIEFQNQN